MHLSLSAKLKKSLFHEYKCLWLYQENLLIYLFIAGKGSVCASRILYPRDSPGENTGVGCCDPLQDIFLTQGSNPHLLCLLHWQAGS